LDLVDHLLRLTGVDFAEREHPSSSSMIERKRKSARLPRK
jgi:hypothetical protein